MKQSKQSKESHSFKLGLVGLALALLLGFIWPSPWVRAQTACLYADLHFDTTLTVDAEAVCEAAQPWSEQGVRVLIVLTDFRPGSEDDWFDFLDKTEAEAGFRDLSRADSFMKNALALEFSTATDIAWGQSVTLGERLYETGLDTDAAVARLKNEVRTRLVAGDPTGALVGGVQTAYGITYPPPSPFLWIGLGLLGVGALGGAGYYLTPRVIKPALARRRRQQALQAHLALLQSRTTNLLAACDRLLAGSTAKETVLYQLFSVYGGEEDDEIQAETEEWLRRSQAALQDAFDLRQKLDDPIVSEKRSLEDQVNDWELLYLTLTGNTERILTLTDDELRQLLDPMVTLEREETDDAQLAAQLDGIRRELAGMPLKVELMMADPAQVDAEGILGYVDRVQGQIAFLRTVQREAPERLAEAQAERAAAANAVPADFTDLPFLTLTPEDLFQHLDEQLAEAEAMLAQDRALSALQGAEDVLAALAVVRKLVETMAEHQRLQAEIEAITASGYRPGQLAEDRQEIEDDLKMITAEIKGNNYAEAGRWIEELAADDQRALAGAQAWRDLEQQNITNLAAWQAEQARLRAYQTNDVAPAWQTLKTYPEANWSDVKPGWQAANETLQGFAAVVQAVEHLNTLTVQQFDEAERRLDEVGASLIQAEQSFNDIINRLAEVQAAEQHLAETERVTITDLERTETFRDQEDRKITPAVDDQLLQARARLDEGVQLGQQRHYLAAMAAFIEARNLATAAYATANEQVRDINTLQTDLETLAESAAGTISQIKSEVNALPTPAKMDKTTQLVQQAITALSEAKQAQIISADLEDRAWAEALRTAITAYDTTRQRANEALSSIEVDRETYNKLRRDVDTAIRQAKSIISRAETATGHRDAGWAGQKALHQAKSLLPQGLPKHASHAALKKILQQAREANKAAARAENQARQQIRAAQAKRERQRRTTWTSSSSSSWGSSSSSSSRSSWGSSSGSSSFGSSSRSSSFGSSSSRSSSMGSSRRR